MTWVVTFFNASTERHESFLFGTEFEARAAMANDWFSVYECTLSVCWNGKVA